MTPITSSETLYESALKYIGASPDNNSIESRKCRLLGNIGPDGEGFGSAFRTAVGLDADSSTPEFSRTVQAWAMWGQFIETKNGRQGDTVVTEDFVGIVDSIGEHEIRAIGFQNGAVRIAKVSRPKAMIRRAFGSPTQVLPEATITEGDGIVTHPTLSEEDSKQYVENPNPVISNIDAMKETMDQENMQAILNKDGTPKGKPGRKPRLQTT